MGVHDIDVLTNINVILLAGSWVEQIPRESGGVLAPFPHYRPAQEVVSRGQVSKACYPSETAVPIPGAVDFMNAATTFGVVTLVVPHPG